MTRLYELLFRIIQLFRIPNEWVFGSKPEFEELVISGRIKPGRAIDLGCGAGIEAIFLSKNGFDGTGVDFSKTAIKLARKRAQEEAVEIDFVQDDLTSLTHVSGTFDFLLDYGALNDLNQEDRDAYVKNVLPLSQTNSQFMLMCFDNKLPMAEVEQRFGGNFDIETITKKAEVGFGRTIMIYLMTRS